MEEVKLMLTVPEIRGIREDRRPDTERPYSAESYAAQYGIGIEDAEDLIAQAEPANHGVVKRRIYRRFSLEPELRRKALMVEDKAAIALTGEEAKRMERTVGTKLRPK